MAGGGIEPGVILHRHAGRADDMHDARLGGEFGIVQRGGRRGEIEHRITGGEHRQRIVGECRADGLAASQHTGILAKRLSPFALDGAGKRCAVGVQNGSDERAAHASRRADNSNPHHGR